MEEMIKLVAQHGTGAILAVICLWMYREASKEAQAKYAEDRKASEERYAADRKESETRYAALALDFREIVTSNTEATTKLCSLIETQARNGHGAHK